ncbi:MAG TPA: CsbD family protein [Acidisarcina sp.]
MNKSNVGGKVDEVKGKIKQGVGEAIGDDKLANSGAADQVKGAAKETWGNAKDAVNAGASRNKASGEVHTANARNTVVDAANKVKNSVNAKIDKHREK